MDGVESVTLSLMGGHTASGKLTAAQMKSLWWALSQVSPVGYLRIETERNNEPREMAVPYRCVVGVEYPRGEKEEESGR